jgi:hypothetical protein
MKVLEQVHARVHAFPVGCKTIVTVTSAVRRFVTAFAALHTHFRQEAVPSLCSSQDRRIQVIAALRPSVSRPTPQSTCQTFTNSWLSTCREHRVVTVYEHQHQGIGLEAYPRDPDGRRCCQ